MNCIDRMRVSFSHNDTRTLRRIPSTTQESHRIVPVGQSFPDLFDPGPVDADDPDCRETHARTAAPTARRYSASACSATRGQSCAGGWSRL